MTTQKKEKEIKRDAGDKTKGFTLQKQRALALFFDEIKSNPNAHINVAIEFRGDVYLQNSSTDENYIEEEKNFDSSTAFSFNSHQIINTLAYFLQIWLSENKSESIKFGFYTTNKIAKENNTAKTTLLNITLTEKPILELLSKKSFTEEAILLENVRKYLVDEYNKQYEVDVTTELEDIALTKFLNSVNWFFEQDNEKDYEKEVIERIKNSEFSSNLHTIHHVGIVYASLMFALEKKQDENDPILKFLKKDSVENIFLKVGSGQPIDFIAYKYLNFDYSELSDKIRNYLTDFLKNKYFANVKDKSFPELIQRKVAQHNKEVKIRSKNLQQANPQHAKHLEVIIKELGDLINSDKPTFLFGEIGSGKSSLLAHYFLSDIENGTFPIFIPSSFLKGKITTEIVSFKSLINDFINNELNLSNKFFDLETVLLTKKEITLIIDGLDEFDRTEAQKLLQHLLRLSDESVNLRIIASGRPIELQDIVNFNDWNCLTTLDLTESEIKQILKNEAIGVGMNIPDAISDSKRKFQILQSKQELYSNATTPLIVCLIRDFLEDNVISKTLGDILYDVLKKRFIWNEDDNKVNFEHFIREYPHALQREKLISAIAYKLYQSTNSKINDDALFELIDSHTLIPLNTYQRNQVVDEAIKFIKNNFLQKLGNDFVFQSHQLFQLALGLHLFNLASTNQEFNFKDSYENEWRIISFAGTVARRKDERIKTNLFFTNVLDKLLVSKGNTPLAAIILAELQYSESNSIFFSKVKDLGFRPLMFMGNSDSAVSHSYAYILKDVGEEGFNWFFEYYLSPKYPTRLGLNQFEITILKFYLIQCNYLLQDYENKQLSEIIPYNIAAETYTCDSLFPILVLALPDKFEIKERCILLAQALKINIVSNRAKELLMNLWSSGNEVCISHSLELACKTENTNINSLILWFDLNINKTELTKQIFHSSIHAISKDNEDIFITLKERIGESNLKSYLRYSALFNNNISDAASIILYKFFGERDLLLIGPPIIKKTSWFDYRDLEREKILNDLVYNNGEKGLLFLINNIPNPEGKLGLSEVYTKYFLNSLLISSDLHINQFLKVVMNLGTFSLPRYPEIRELFIKVLKKKKYYDEIRSRLDHLDTNFRYNIACILLIYSPETEKEALEIIIKSVIKRLSDNQEWLRLCMKLTYSTYMLDYVFDLLDELLPISKIFALKLLYHNNKYKLSESHIQELLLGLLGDAKFLDWSGYYKEDDIIKITSEDGHYGFLKETLNSEDFYLRQSAAANLIYYHLHKLTYSEKAICWLLHVQYSIYTLYDFHRSHRNLFSETEFVKELKTYALENENLIKGKKFLLLIYYQILKENGDWNDLFIHINSGKALDHNHIEGIYDILIEVGKSNATVGENLGKCIKNLISYPIYSEDKDHNYVLPQFAILAHEFGSLNDDELLEIIESYDILESEIACSLLYRLSNIPNTYHPHRSYIPRDRSITSYKPTIIGSYNKEEIEKLLIDGDIIPAKLTEAIEWVLLKETFTNEELILLAKKGNLATCFVMIVVFCRHEKTAFTNFLESEDIGSYKYFAKAETQLYKSILLKIKNIHLSNKKEKENYIKALIDSITSNNCNDIVDVFTELFDLDADFEPILLVDLFNTLLDVPYRLNLSLVYKINNYIVNVEVENIKILVVSLKQILAAILCKEDNNHTHEFELLAWTISLLLLFIEEKSCLEAERGFLIGLKNIFIQDGSSYYTDSSEKKFKGRDLLIQSNLIFSKIDNSLIREILEKGIKSDVPEISSVCKLIAAFNK